MVSENPKIFVPPQPRYLLESCCADSSHGTNLNTEGYRELILGNLTRVRNLLKQELIKRKVKNFWVLDSFAIVGNAKHSDHEEVLNNLAVISEDDGVHFSLLGYETLTAEISVAIDDLVDGKIGQAALRTKEGLPKKQTYFWRGFQSHNGSVSHRYKAVPFGRNAGAGKGRAHPYRRN